MCYSVVGYDYNLQSESISHFATFNEVHGICIISRIKTY